MSIGGKEREKSYHMTEHEMVLGGTIRIIFVLKPQYINNHIPHILFYANYLQTPLEEIEGRGRSPLNF